MTKVKVVNGYTAKMLEEEINDFISKKDVVSIQYQSQFIEEVGKDYSAMIVYKDGDK